MAKRNYFKTYSSRSSSVPKHWKKRLLVLALVLGGLAMLWSMVMGEMGAVKYARMRSQEHALHDEIGRLKQDNLRLLQEVKSLKYDAAYIERIARDRIGLARPGEIVYYYGDPDSAERIVSPRP
ncbi:MAG: septum formation initiator family protein [Nitrospiraceae bacterium]|nr:septum formation initiator family protein [Nitrospiraceae bacterium]